MSETKLLHEHGIIAFVRLEDLTGAIDVTKALVAGGVTAVEFTFTNPLAGQAIEAVRADWAIKRQLAPARSLIRRRPDCSDTRWSADTSSRRHPAATVELQSVRRPDDHRYVYRNRNADGAGGRGELYQGASGQPGRPQVLQGRPAPLPFLKLIPSGGVTENAAEFIRAGAVAVAIGSNLVNGRPSLIVIGSRSQPRRRP